MKIEDIASVITLMLLNKYNQNSFNFKIKYQIVHNILISIINNKSLPFNFIFTFLLDYYYIFISIVILYSLYYAINYYIINFKSNNVSLLTVYDIDTIFTVIKYITHNDYYSKIKDLNYGDSECVNNLYSDNSNKYYEISSKIKFPKKGTITYIDDKDFNICGKVIWDYEIKNITNDKNDNIEIKKIYFLKFIMNTDCSSSIIQYLNNINKFLSSKSKTIKFYHYKYINDIRYASTTTNNKISDKDLEKKYIDSFFHSKKDRLWSIIKNVHFNPDYFTDLGQPARFNMIAYGPPGTGKSSFAYRIARALNRNIVSVDLSTIKNKQELFCTFNNSTHLPSQTVFILDEFDFSIKKIANRTNTQNKKLNNFINAYLKNTNITEDDILSDSNLLSSLSLDDKIKYNFEKNIINNEEITIKDILELLQGVVPLEQSIIIATTNDLDTIKNINEALIRPGRLTPVKFDYLDFVMFEKLCIFYFNKKPPHKKFINFKLNITTSLIIELALQNKNDFDNFIQDILSL
jgi:DNA replication protein DnaC